MNERYPEYDLRFILIKIVSICNETQFNDVLFEFSMGFSIDVDYSFVVSSLKTYSRLELLSSHEMEEGHCVS